MLRLGCGAGFSSDRLGPAIDLAEKGRLDYLVFETCAERTLAFAHRDRKLDPRRGYNPQLRARMRGVLKAAKANGTRIVTNMGVANVPEAAKVVVEVARELGLKGLKVAAVTGDEVTDLLGPDTRLFDNHDKRIDEVGLPFTSANAYLGLDAILPALESGADVVITGRVADPSLFLAPIAHKYGWRTDDWAALGKGTLVGHLLECGMQITGGYFADPGRKDVPRLADCGYPIAEVAADGSAVITKLADAGGMVTARTVKEQLLYEVHDPARYLTPDVTADFSRVELAEDGRDRVRVAKGNGSRRPDTLKVTVGFDGGFLAEAGVSYAGPNATGRAQLAADILRERLGRESGIGRAGTPLRIDLIGLNALHGTAHGARQAAEDVRVRVAMRTADRTACETMLWEVESLLCCGPAGGGGYRGQITPSVVTHSALIARERVMPRVEVLVA
ncbi:MAG: acyclic terpene utilization AtuA family protein [Hyphomicrobiaceae bacterium]|nr:acyclic terpene utilization AtuA family protein [Hyphomicrobiaceae bacterium]